MKTALLTIMFMLAGCAPGGGLDKHSREQAGALNVPSDASSCRRAGGTMKPVGRRQTIECVLDYADAGKSCTEGGQCAGDCRTPPSLDVRPGQQVAGYCQATSDRFGCSTTVESGRAGATICID